MTKLALGDLVKSIKDLPTLPTIVLDLMRNLNDQDSDSNELSEKIAQDQALSAKTLRLANSSFYGMQRKVATIRQAITILGINGVRALVSGAAVVESYSANESSSLDFQAFWRHSIGTALCAKALAAKLALNQDHAFMVGLLHDIGRLVIITWSAQQYEAVIAYRQSQDCHLFEAEQEILGFDHAAAGRAIMAHWKLPPLMLDAVEHHHSPLPENSDGLPALLHLADCIAHGLDLSASEDDLTPPLSASVWQSLHLTETDLRDIFQETERQFEETCSILLPAEK